MSAETRTRAAIGVVTAATAARSHPDDDRENLAEAVASLLPDLYAEGPVRAALTFAALVEAAVLTAAASTGNDPAVIWQAVIGAVTRTQR